MTLHMIIDHAQSPHANDYDPKFTDDNALSPADIQYWLVDQLATYIGLDPHDIDVYKPCTEYGLDSIAGVSIAGDLEVWLDLQLAPTLLWDYPSIHAISHHIMERLNANPLPLDRHPAPTAPTGIALTPEQASHILTQLNTLSDADVDAMLSTLQAA